MISFKPAALAEIVKFVSSLESKGRFAISFNFARTVSLSSDLGKEIRRSAPEDVIRDLAQRSWPNAMDDEWTLELVGYPADEIEAEELHTIDGVCVFIPKDLEEFFRDKSLDFREGYFLLD